MAAPLPHRHIHYGSAPRHTTQAPGHMKQLWPVQSTRITAQTAPRAAGLYDGRTPLMIETAHSQMPPEAGRHMRNRGTADIENARHHRLTSVISGGRCRNRTYDPFGVNEVRGLNLGKVALYQLSYVRMCYLHRQQVTKIRQSQEKAKPPRVPPVFQRLSSAEVKFPNYADVPSFMESGTVWASSLNAR